MPGCRPPGVLSASWSSAAVSIAPESTACPFRIAARASHAATSATAQAWRTDHGAGSSERNSRAASRRVGTGMGRSVARAEGRGPGTLGPDADSLGPEVHLDGPVSVRPVHAAADIGQAAKRLGGRVPVVVAAPTEIRAAGRPCRGEERRRTSPSAAVMGDLEDVQPRETRRPSNAGSTSSSASPTRRNRRPAASPSSTIGESLIPRPVDAAARLGTPAGVRPQQRRAGMSPRRRCVAGGWSVPRAADPAGACLSSHAAQPGPGAVHPRLEDAPHPISLEHRRTSPAT